MARQKNRLDALFFPVPCKLCALHYVLDCLGGGIGFLVGTVDWNFNPHIIFKIIFGFFGGLYLSCPNFGMVNSLTIPWEARNRHKLIDTLK
jgi:hypothetical protein